MKLISALILVGIMSACGPAVVRKHYLNSNASTAAPGGIAQPVTSSTTLYTQDGQPVIVQPGPVNVTNNISIIVTTITLYTVDGKPVKVDVCHERTHGNGHHGKGHNGD